MPASFMESPRFPDDISVGVSFGPEFVTTIASNQAGYEYRNRVRSRALSKGDCTHSVKTQAQFKTLVTFFRSVGGRFSGFRFKDWSDYKLDYSDSYFEPITGTVNQYQINKLYKAAVGFEEYRQIRKPVSGTLTIKVVNAVNTNYTFDYTTGIVTFNNTGTRTATAHTVGSTHKTTISSTFTPTLTVGQRISFTGVTGTAASVLNNVWHTVTAVGLIPDVDPQTPETFIAGTEGRYITISTSTSGLTASGGNIVLYPDPLLGLSATCEFDVPARFDTDHMPAVLTHPDVFDWGQIPIVEIRV